MCYVVTLVSTYRDVALAYRICLFLSCYKGKIRGGTIKYRCTRLIVGEPVFTDGGDVMVGRYKEVVHREGGSCFSTIWWIAESSLRNDKHLVE